MKQIAWIILGSMSLLTTVQAEDKLCWPSQLGIDANQQELTVIKNQVPRTIQEVNSENNNIPEKQREMEVVGRFAQTCDSNNSAKPIFANPRHDIKLIGKHEWSYICTGDNHVQTVRIIYKANTSGNLKGLLAWSRAGERDDNCFTLFEPLMEDYIHKQYRH